MTDGLTFDLRYPEVDRPYAPNGKRIAEMMQGDLAKLGMRLNLRSAKWTDYRDRM